MKEGRAILPNLRRFVSSLGGGIERPQGYEVTLETFEGKRFTYSVLTFMGIEKAIVMAVAALTRERPEAEVFDVRVKHLGIPKLSQRGYEVEGFDLVDRKEW